MSTVTNAAPQSAKVGEVLLEVEDLSVAYLTQAGPVPACDQVSFTLRRGEILGVAGESGSGKSTLITALLRLQRPPAVTTGGRIVYHPDGAEPVDLVRISERGLRRYRWNDLAIVMQSAMHCLNPVLRLSAQFVDVVTTHNPSMSKADALARAGELLRMVGIAEDRLSNYAHELSGGMRQRALIALALACNPQLIVMDEPTTAVDVVMQRQILAQVIKLQAEFGFAVIFVTHDLSLLMELADRIAIMYAGRLVELGAAADLYTAPLHPYTKGLRDSFPPLHGDLTELRGIPGTPPNLLAPPSGCAFHPRCPRRFDACDTTDPALIEHDGREVACLLYGPEGTPR